MKLHSSQIPEGGLRRTLRIDAKSLPRLRELCEEQAGTLHAELLLKERGGCVEVRGQLSGEFHAPCSRCTEPILLTLDHPVELTLVPEEQGRTMSGDLELSAGDLDVSFFDNDEIDLEAIIEEELVLFYPDAGCEEDEQGHCTRCGRTLEDLYEPPQSDDDYHPFANMKKLIT